MKNYELMTEVKISNGASLEYKDEPINITVKPTLKSGTYFGRIGDVYKFTSKKGTDYLNIPMATRLSFNNQEMILEVSKVLLAEYYEGSQLVNLLTELGAVIDKKFHPEKLMNLPVKFTVVPNENADANSKYKEMVTDIEVVDKIPEHLDFWLGMSFN